MHIARSITVTGHVQGVFFREWSVQIASGLDVEGWVRNCSDGSVEIYAAGEPNRIERFISELRQGSPASRVDSVEVQPVRFEEVSGFMRRASA